MTVATSFSRTIRRSSGGSSRNETLTLKPAQSVTRSRFLVDEDDDDGRACIVYEVFCCQSIDEVLCVSSVGEFQSKGQLIGSRLCSEEEEREREREVLFCVVVWTK
jgi:hypothetical protein